MKKSKVVAAVCTAALLAFAPVTYSTSEGLKASEAECAEPWGCEIEFGSACFNHPGPNPIWDYYSNWESEA
jgi:hypothetical protein